MTYFLSQRKSERDAGGGGCGGRGRVAVGLAGGVVVATGTGAQVSHGVGADGGGWGAVADGPAAASRASQLKQRGRAVPGPVEVGDDLGDDHAIMGAKRQRPPGGARGPVGTPGRGSPVAETFQVRHEPLPLLAGHLEQVLWIEVAL